MKKLIKLFNFNFPILYVVSELDLCCSNKSRMLFIEVIDLISHKVTRKTFYHAVLSRYPTDLG